MVLGHEAEVLRRQVIRPKPDTVNRKQSTRPAKCPLTCENGGRRTTTVPSRNVEVPR